MQSKRIYIILVFLLMITLSCSSLRSGGSRNATFESPEAVITAYFEGLAQADFDKISQTFATDEMSEKFDFEAYTDWLGGYFLPMQTLAPTDDPFFVESNKLQLASQNFSKVKIFIFSLLSDEEVEKGVTIQGMDRERVDQFLKDLDLARLADLEIIEIALPHEEMMRSSQYRKNASRVARVYGADESTERVVLFKFEGDYYYLGLTFFCYEDNWKISSPTSALAGTNAMGVPESTTRKNFEKIINE